MPEKDFRNLPLFQEYLAPNTPKSNLSSEQIRAFLDALATPQTESRLTLAERRYSEAKLAYDTYHQETALTNPNDLKKDQVWNELQAAQGEFQQAQDDQRRITDIHYIEDFQRTHGREPSAAELQAFKKDPNGPKYRQ